MTEPFIGEIQLFGFNFNPRGWAFANGATLPISQNTALFSLIGITYGGNGQTTFQLPNFAARAGCQQGNSPGLSPRTLGQSFGVDMVTLNSGQIPQHSHGINAYVQSDTTKRVGTPASNGGMSIPGSTGVKPFASSNPNTTFAPNMISPSAGGGQPHQNQQPYLGVNFCIALQGNYPPFP
ncbi:tail fiber protein [Stenotrophomonas acidaminiphila]|uniref:phage tail protein n=1 Tax=Stenotrophomonas acidaminiphila TaxID=128780 RepID=UPI00289E0AA9|nr:tail fiber protein [Stenotrophomonas acidaminiphila]